MGGGPVERGLTEGTTVVRGHPVGYLRGGTGPTVLFLHGWGLSCSAYRSSLAAMRAGGLHVLAPSLPGFGGTPALSGADLTLTGYARWVAELLEALGEAEPVVVVGHSFGGGVAIRLAHDFPHLVSRLVLVNSIGGSAWTAGTAQVLHALQERPLWDWGLHLGADVLPLRQLTRVIPVVLQDALRNAVRNPGAVWNVAHLARTSDLRAELRELARRELPVVVAWGLQDRVLPQASLAALRLALGEDAVITLTGEHNWMITKPDRLTEIITNVTSVPDLTPAVPASGPDDSADAA